jgi:hypothetical protein
MSWCVDERLCRESCDLRARVLDVSPLCVLVVFLFLVCGTEWYHGVSQIRTRRVGLIV